MESHTLLIDFHGVIVLWDIQEVLFIVIVGMVKRELPNLLLTNLLSVKQLDTGRFANPAFYYENQSL